MDGMKKVPVREQEPKVRATNFEEVCYGYNEEEAVAEASTTKSRDFPLKGVSSNGRYDP